MDRENDAGKYTYSFKNFQTIKTFGRDIYDGKITLKKSNEYQADLLTEIMYFKKNTKPRSDEKKNKKKKLFFKTYIIFFMLLIAKYFWQNLRVQTI